MQPNKIEQGTKHDSAKRKWWYLWNFIEPLKQVVDVLTIGDTKYPSPDGCNWKKVPNAKQRYKDAMVRHIVEGYLAGEIYDKETGKHHLAHAVTNMLFLMWFEMVGEKEA